MAKPTTGAHVLCASVGNSTDQLTKNAVLRDPEWSETVTADGTLSHVVTGGKKLLRIRAFQDGWFAIGKTPNASLASSTASQSAREFIAADETIDRYVKQGEKIAWKAA